MVADYAGAAFFDDVAEETPFWESSRYVFEAVEIKPAEGGQFGPSNEWTFMVYLDTNKTPAKTDDNGQPCTLRQFISTKMTPGSRGRPLVEAILGRRLEDGEQIRPADVLGKLFAGLISNEPPKNDPRGKVRPYLRNPEKLRAQPSRAVPPPRRPAPPQVEDLDDLPF